MVLTGGSAVAFTLFFSLFYCKFHVTASNCTNAERMTDVRAHKIFSVAIETQFWAAMLMFYSKTKAFSLLSRPCWVEYAGAIMSPAVRQPSPSRTAGDKRRPGTARYSLRPLFPFARAARVSPHSRRSSASQRPILDDSKRRVSWPRRWPPDPSAPASLRRPPRRACGDSDLRLLPRPRLHRRRLRPAR